MAQKEKEMKYSELNLGQVEAIVNKLGGMNGVQRFLRGELTVSARSASPIPINRSAPFNSEKFIGKGWTIKEEDTCSLALNELDLTKVSLETMLRPDELSVKGEERLRRLKESNFIRLDAKMFQTLWENKAAIPESWKERVVFFDGTILRSLRGDRCILSLYWHNGKWYWVCYQLNGDFSFVGPSAVLTS